MAAAGSVPQTSPVKGADMPGVYLAEEVFGREHELGNKVVVIGGGDTGREAALYLAKAGHDTTMVTRKQAKLYDDLHAKRATELDYENEPNFHCIEHASTLEVSPKSVTLDVTIGMPKQDVMFEMMHDSGPREPDVMPDPRPEGFPQRRPLMPMHTEDGPKNGPGHAKPAPKVDPATLPHEIRTIECDAVVISGGRQSVAVEAFRDCAPEFCVIGDALLPCNIRNCNNTAFAAVMKL